MLRCSTKQTNNTAELRTAKSSPPLESPVSLDEVHATLENDSLTELQKSEFTKKHNGRIVKWSGYVESVSPVSFPSEDRGFFLMFKSESQVDKLFPNLAIATFPQNAKLDLVNINENDWVEIQGRLHIHNPQKYSTIALNESKLLRHKKAASEEN